MPKKIKDKATNKITIRVSSDFDEDQYKTLKTLKFINDNFKRVHQFNYGVLKYIALYPIISYNNEDEFEKVCSEIQKVLVTDVKFTYKYIDGIYDLTFKVPKVQFKKHVEFIEESD